MPSFIATKFLTSNRNVCSGGEGRWWGKGMGALLMLPMGKKVSD